MRPVVTDRVAWSVGLSVYLCVTVVRSAKTAEQIDMPFLRDAVWDLDSGEPMQGSIVLGGSTVAPPGKYH